MRTPKCRVSTHPGEILKDELEARGISLNQLARNIRVPMNRVSTIVNCKRGITPDTAVRLELCLGIDASFWLRLQAAHDLGLVGRAALKREVIKAA